MEMLIALVILIVTLIIGIPIPFVFLATVIYLIFSLGYDPSFLIPYGFSKLNNMVLLAIPLFIMAGGMMSLGGIGRRIVDFTEMIVGKTKGGMGVVTIIACAIFGAMSGSAAAALNSIGAIMFPRLEKSGYSKGFAASLIISSSVLGLLIPPSAIMILYAWIGNQSVLASFLATLGPGIILMILLSIINTIYMKDKDINIQQNNDNPELLSTSKKRTSMLAIPGLLMPFIVLGGIYSGAMTPTEAAAVAVVYSIPIGFWFYKELNRKRLYQSFVEAATTTGVLMVMLFGIMLLSRIIIMENIPDTLMKFLLSITENTLLLMLLINLFLIVIGMLMDDVSAVLLATPLLLPIVVNLGIDPIHFAAIIGVNLGMGLLTPPTAPLLYLGGRMSKAPINTMMGPTMLMILFAWLPTLIITTFIPEVALFLPRLLLGL
ncbi:C4-dicarboxylate ABC transporter permease [Salipaludibacillus neizhouensis]|uniref:C4-dicarboxylate ABC transporter permease n=1 Tax=Salipaludibacillus neizhouensis TaxID=885475 RepID=A0A3A9JX11_9BACI|nr:TRAP transporter large permease subunit [Salipaludibacillus neizhouensis]RKL64799.1 C4-dicarboxylate ABC transporter permease [Salipaludibacillus neizhouensis]